MILFIDTCKSDSVRFALIPKKGARSRAAQKTFPLARNANHATLALLEEFLRAKKIVPKDITKIIACSGPGSFNGVRVGITIAQALGLAWSLPVKTIPAGETAKW